MVLAQQLNGKELSFNNISDTNGALELLKEFEESTVVACKHGNPCGVGSGDNIDEAWIKASSADMTSIFGGIVVLNEELTLAIAQQMKEIFLEVVVAPAYNREALELLQQKPNLRLLELPSIRVKQRKSYDIKKISGGILLQTSDDLLLEETKVVSKRLATKKEIEDLLFAWKVVKHTKSNGIVLVKDKQTIGIGPGQVNRIWSLQQAIEHCKELLDEKYLQKAVMASEAFFPFSDCVTTAAQAGISAIIQPGGSKNDQESIDKCDEFDIAMIFTNIRHFKH